MYELIWLADNINITINALVLILPKNLTLLQNNLLQLLNAKFKKRGQHGQGNVKSIPYSSDTPYDEKS